MHNLPYGSPWKYGLAEKLPPDVNQSPMDYDHTAKVNSFYHDFEQ
jgi:hypothetical protein